MKLSFLTPLLLCTFVAGSIWDDLASVIPRKSLRGPLPTTPHMREVFIGRCYEALREHTHMPASFDCGEYWNLFEKSYTNRTAGAVDVSEFVQMSNFESTGEGRPTFWSGCKDIVEMASTVSDMRLQTLEKTFTGTILDGLVFCESPVNGTCNYKQSMAMGYVWGNASAQFAAHARGDINAVLYPHSGTAFRPSSFFGRVEIPHLVPAQISSVHVISLANDEFPDERCGQGSFSHLQDTLAAWGLGDRVKCSDDPLSLLHLMCATNPQHSKCDMSGDRDSESRMRVMAVVVSVTTVGAMTLVAVVVYALWRQHPQSRQTLLTQLMR